jgi:hypothetical protein
MALVIQYDNKKANHGSLPFYNLYFHNLMIAVI